VEGAVVARLGQQDIEAEAHGAAVADEDEVETEVKLHLYGKTTGHSLQRNLRGQC
jgi:hypothetical protein